MPTRKAPIEGSEISGISERGLCEALAVIGATLRWNTRAGRPEVSLSEDPDVPIWTPVTDRQDAGIREKIRSACFVSMKNGEIVAATFGRERWKTCLDALLLRHEVDPVAEWIETLPEWDGIPRVDDILGDLWDCQCPLAKWASLYLVLAPIQRTKEPGSLLREIPVLIGGQGAGKSELIRSLCVDPEWFGDALDFAERSQQRVEACLGKLVVEASEMAGAGRTEVESIKAFISRRDDYLRLAYAHYPEHRPRRFAIMGTANDTGNGVLPNDPSGNSRFVAITIPSHRSLVGKISTHVVRHRDQWFSEACSRYLEGERANLPQKLVPAQAEAAEEHARRDIGLEDMLAGVALGDTVRIGDVVEAIGQSKEWGDRHAKRIGAVLRGQGYSRAKIRIGSRTVWAWRQGQGAGRGRESAPELDL